jgi:hypothetical protein
MSNNPEIAKEIDLNNEPKKDTPRTSGRVSISVLGEKQITPEELIARGGGSGILSVCQKL